MKHKLVLVKGISSALLLISNHRMSAEPPPFSLDVEVGGNKIPLTVPPTKQVDFSLVQSNVLTPPATIDLHLSPFIGEQGNSVTVKLVIPGIRNDAEVDQPGIVPVGCSGRSDQERAADLANLFSFATEGGIALLVIPQSPGRPADPARSAFNLNRFGYQTTR